MKITIISLILILSLLPFVNADSLKFISNQSDYYFLVGENAIIPFTLENYKDPVTGLITYTVTQSIQQQGFSYSNSNTKSQNIEINTNPFILNFGSSDKPSNLVLDMKFQYKENNQDIFVSIPKIRIFFVNDEKEKQNQENKQVSSSQTQEDIDKQNKEAAKQQQKALENQMKQQQEQNKLQNRLQNNQQGQDTGSLNEQIKNELQKQEEQKKEFAKNLENNPNFQKENQDLQNQGFKPESSDINPTNPNSGDFKVNYKRDDGETASLSGKMDNNEIKELKKISSLDNKEMQKNLENDERFKKFNEELTKEGYEKKNIEFNKINQTYSVANVTYLNSLNETASIDAEFNNLNVESVKLNKNKKSPSLPLLLFAILSIIPLALIMVYRFYPKNKKSQTSVTLVEPESIFDFKEESKKLLEESKLLFKENKPKHAYGKASEAIRLYLSYKYELKKEITSSELIKELKKHKIDITKIQECLNLCSLVEFAKYVANKKDFDEIIKLAENIIK